MRERERTSRTSAPLAAAQSKSPTLNSLPFARVVRVCMRSRHDVSNGTPPLRRAEAEIVQTFSVEFGAFVVCSVWQLKLYKLLRPEFRSIPCSTIRSSCSKLELVRKRAYLAP